MEIFYKFGRFCSFLLPFALLAVFFKYLHQLNSMLTSIEGVGFRKTLLILFIAFFAIWSLVYLSAVFFVRALSWVWTGTIATSIEKSKIPMKQESEQPLKNDIESKSIKDREELFRLDLQGESAA